MRLLLAELLKLRRRWASYIILGVLIGLMALVYILIGLTGQGAGLTIRFPQAYDPLNEFVFGLGSLLAVVYAAAVAGADWSWGIFGVVVARGESRVRYVLAKAGGIAIALAVGVLVAFAAGILLTFLAGSMAGVSVGDPFAQDALGDLGRSVGYGYVVILERAAIGFAVALVLRSQMAGVVVGIVLYFGEAILIAILTVASLGAGGFEGIGNLQPRGPEWFQYLPFSIGDGVLAEAVATQSVTDPDVTILLRPIPFDLAMAGTVIYLAIALLVGMLFVRRAQLTGSAG